MFVKAKLGKPFLIRDLGSLYFSVPAYVVTPPCQLSIGRLNCLTLKNNGVNFIYHLMELLDVKSFEEIEGNYVKLYVKDGGIVANVGSIVNDNWIEVPEEKDEFV